MLTGAPFFTTWHGGSTDDAEDLWKYIDEELTKKSMVTTSTPYTGSDADFNDFGLAQTHAYTVLETLEVQAGEQSQKLYKMRNPWGTENYNGDWSDKSSLWTEILKKTHSIKMENDGIWYISAEDYLINFD